jgi:AraC-like DNA-binding protein/Flp pilus assembly protein TadD
MPRGVRRALDALRADPGRDWGMRDLAAVAGLSCRSLQRQFRAFLRKPPLALLRDIRFDGARRELLQGATGMRVMDVALRWGFPHFGRFSTEYRRRYGETPSQTLRRQVALLDALVAAPMILPPHGDQPAVTVGEIDADAGAEDIARAVADELATALVRTGLAVTSRPGQARYRMTGILRESGGALRLTLRLLDAETGRHLWAHRSDAAPGAGFGFDEQQAARVVAALQPGLRLAEIDRARRKPDAHLSAYDLTLRAMPHVLSMDAEGNARALELLERARERDPQNALATCLAAWAHAQRVVYHFSAAPAEDRIRGTELAHKALTLGGDASALAILGNALTSLNAVETAAAVIRKALSIDGGCAWAWSRGGWVDVYRGDSDSAIERFLISLELAPQDSLAFNNLVGIGVAHFNAGRYREAAEWQERALQEHPTAAWVHRTMCPAYVLAGAPSDARRSLAALRANYPELTVASVQQGLPPLRPAVRELVFGALQAAGLPA